MTAGKVYLVGAGPGDPGLITVRGRRIVESADVLVHDRLLDERILGWAQPGAEVIDVGKTPGEERNRQEDIDAVLADRARAGKMVVRLKGGDPFVFGRGGEEAGALAGLGIPFEIVPGVTSAVAAPAYAGIPVTHRGLGSLFTVVTGSEAPGKAEPGVNWAALAAQGGTLVILMGWKNLPAIVEALVANGRSPETPAALVRWGTYPRQETVVATLGTVVEEGRRAGIASPVVVVVGEVVALRDGLRWYDNRPLFGRRVLVTRTRAQAGRLSALLAERGAVPIEVAAIRIEPLEDHTELDSLLCRLGEFEWTILSSANNVEIVFGRLAAMGLDARAFHGTRVVALGPATAAALLGHGIAADIVPARYVSEGVVEAMREAGVDGARVLLPRSSAGRESMVAGLTALGAHVTQVAAYRPAPADSSRGLLRETLAEGVDAATFTSSSTVRSLVSLLDGDVRPLDGARIACIGAVTAQTAEELGLKVDVVPSESTVPALVAALERSFGSG